jgi:hypothetical protein
VGAQQLCVAARWMVGAHGRSVDVKRSAEPQRCRLDTHLCLRGVR